MGDEEREESRERPVEEVLAELMTNYVGMKEGDKSSEGSSNRKVDGPRQSGKGERSRRMAPQLVNDFVDEWVELQLPFTPGCLRLTAERIFACRSKKSAVFWLPHSLLRHSRALWSKAKWSAISLASNGDESIIVRVDEKGCCFLLVCPLSPSSAEWMSLNTKSMRVKEVSVRGKDAWMVVEGGVLLSLLLPDQAIYHFLDCEWPLRCLTTSAYAVWAIRADDGSLVARVGFTRNAAFGEDWVNERPSGPSRLCSISLFGFSAFLLDELGSLWRVDSVDANHPFGKHFYQVFHRSEFCLPSAFATSACLLVSSAGVFYTYGRRLFYSSSPLSSHRFMHCIPPRLAALDCFSRISSGGFAGGRVGILVSLKTNEEILVYRPESSDLAAFLHQRRVEQLGGRMRAMSSIVGWTVVATDRGVLCLPEGEEETSPLPFSLSLPLSFPSSSLRSLSLSSRGVWVVVDAHTILFYSLRSMSLPPTYVSSEAEIDKVFASAGGRYVWMLSHGQPFTRTAISESDPTGKEWMEGPAEPLLSSLAVGDCVVFGVSVDGSLLRLRGLSASSPAGTRWAFLSSAYSFKEASLDGQGLLWLIGWDHRLIRHEVSIFSSVKAESDAAC